MTVLGKSDFKEHLILIASGHIHRFSRLPMPFAGWAWDFQKQDGCVHPFLAMQRLRVLAKGELTEVHLGAYQQAFVAFMFAAIAVFDYCSQWQ